MLTMQQAKEDCGWLGEIVKLHHVGPYSFAEYVQKEISNSKTNGQTFYSSFIDGNSTRHSHTTLDEALIYVIARRNLVEPNTANWFSRAAEAILTPKKDS